MCQGKNLSSEHVRGGGLYILSSSKNGEVEHLVTFIILQKGPERQGQRNYSSLIVEKMPKGIVSDTGKKEGEGDRKL